MSRTNWVALFCVIALLSGCGGGGGKKKPRPAASVQVAVTSAPFSGDIDKGDVFKPTVSGTWTATNLGSSQVYLQISDSAGTFPTPPIALAPSNGTYSFQLSSLSTLSSGSYSGALSVRACQDALCAKPYVGASQSVGYSLKVNAPDVKVKIESAPIAGNIAKSDEFRPTVSGTWTAAHLGSSQVYLQITDSAGTFVMPPLALAPVDGSFNFQVSALSTLALGSYSGALSVRACQDAQCANPYPGAAQSVGYSLTVNPPDVTLAVTSPPVPVSNALGDEVAIGGAWSATYLGTAQVYLQVTDNAGTFASPPVTLASAGHSFDFPLTVSVLGDRSGILTVRACEDLLCTRPYANSVQNVPYTVKVHAVPEWETLQGNAAHNGYVPIRLNSAKFARAWEFARSLPISSVATADEKVFVSEGSSWLDALNEANGAILWKQPFNLYLAPALSPPAATNGKVYIASLGHSSTYLWAFNAADGAPVMQSQFATQWANILAPTVKDGRAFVNAGYYGGVVYGYDASNGIALWNATGGTYGMNTPAVDGNYVYSYNGAALGVHNLADGTVAASIGGQSWGIQTDYHGSPVLGSPDNVIAYLGSIYDSFGNGRYLQNYSVAAQSIRWKSQKTYKTYPAVANGVIYVASNNPKSLDALDEATGQVLWSWVPGTQDTSFQDNVVVTDNLVFVSTNRSIYAVDLRTHQPVWQSAIPGSLAISGKRMLYIATTEGSTGRLTAFSTR